jgi:hypothetical protein
MFVSAGWCEECIARDLLFARDLVSGRIFLVCAACGASGASRGNCKAHIVEAHGQLAPGGWTLASCDEVLAAGIGGWIAGDAPESYVELIAWFPGFRPPGTTAPKSFT